MASSECSDETTAENHARPGAEATTRDLIVVKDGPVLRLTLARPHRRNALARSLVAALSTEFANVGASDEIRVVVLAGEGPVFCAGADLSEFVDVADEAQVRADGEALTVLLDRICACPVPVIAAVHGAVFGGAIGLVCAADLAVAAAGTHFSLSETRLGLIAATISPYVVAALGPREAKARMLLAAPFDAAEAYRIGLVHRVCPAEQLTAAVGEMIDLVLQSPPGALAATKRLVSLVQTGDPAQIRAMTASLLAERRTSAEGQEGMAAFLAKRAPGWIPKRENE